VGGSPVSPFGCRTKKASGETAATAATATQEASAMLRPHQFVGCLPKSEADALNAESGRLDTDMLVCHYRVYRRQGVWLRSAHGERWEDTHGGPTTLHAHSRDAAQQGFSTACKTANACRDLGLDVQYP
jgi:hypothetical protein